MALTVASFLRARPEFESAGEALVASTMEAARLDVSAEQYGDAYDQALSAMTAHILWSSPFGCSMRQEGGGADTESRFIVELRKLRFERVTRMLVL